MNEAINNFQISLAAARVNANMTQQEVADKVHKSKNTIVNWEKGKAKPDFSTLTMLSVLYNVPIDYISVP
ncbi:MAG: helix-turn-helix transcriptional regulator [Oribacterium sp.]|nr:helix-turn-helix transcriptional regulator [Oribacterium sp.]